MISQYNWTNLYNYMDIEIATELFYDTTLTLFSVNVFLIVFLLS